MKTAVKDEAAIYLRLSDMRTEDALEGREPELRALAAARGWTVRDENVVIENDLTGNGQASAWKRKAVTTRDGRVELRNDRPGFRRVLRLIAGGCNLVAEDLDRMLRNQRDGADLLDAIQVAGVTAVSVSGNLTLTMGGTEQERSKAWEEINHAAKASADTSRRVRKGRDRWAGKSYQGGRRPFGFRIDEFTREHQRTLSHDEAEAEIIRHAARVLLDPSSGESLKSLARDLRDRGVPTVTGAAWTASTLRDVLAKPVVAGLAVLRGEVIGKAQYCEPILDPDVWQRLVDLFDSRKTGTSPEPKWLVSLIGTCGLCGAPMKCTGSPARRAYVCRDHGHLRRDAVKTDEFISGLVIARLSQPDVVSILLPPPHQGTDATALRDEARKLTERKASLARLVGSGDMDESDYATARRVITDRLARIDAQLAVTDQTDPLAEFRTDPAGVVWESLSVARRRAVVKLLMNITFVPAKRRGYFDPESIRVTPKV